MFSLAAALLSFVNPLQAHFDAEAEQKLLKCVRSTEFCNEIITYQYGGKQYSIKILHNPTGNPLWGQKFSEPKMLELLVEASLPRDVETHLNRQISEFTQRNERRKVNLSTFMFDFSDEAFLSIQPIVVANQIDDPKADAIVKEAFSTNQFANLTFCYKLNDQYYPVRILYNPEGLTYTTTKKFRLTYGGELYRFTRKWNWKYGLLFHKEAPQELIDHLCQLTNCSWWDWYRNFRICNGTYVEYVEYLSQNLDTVYSLDTWYNFTDDLKLAE